MRLSAAALGLAGDQNERGGTGMASVEEKVKSIIMDQLGVNEAEVTGSASSLRTTVDSLNSRI